MDQLMSNYKEPESKQHLTTRKKTLNYVFVKYALALIILTIARNASGQNAIDTNSVSGIACKLATSRYPYLRAICTPLAFLKKFEKLTKEIDVFFKDVLEKVPNPRLPAITASNTTVVSMLKELQTDIDAIEIPVKLLITSVSQPSFDFSYGGTPEEWRITMTETYSYIDEYVSQFRDLGLLSKSFDELKVELTNCRAQFHTLEKIYLTNTTAVPFDVLMIQNTFGTTGLEIMTHINPKINEIIRIIDDKKSEIEILRKGESRKLDALIENSLLLLEGEQSIINSQSAKLDSIAVRLTEQLAVVLDTSRRAIEKDEELNKEKIEKLTEDLEIAEKGRDTLLKESNLKNAQYKKASSHYENLHFTLCPKGKTLEQCDHLELKKEYKEMRSTAKQKAVSLEMEANRAATKYSESKLVCANLKKKNNKIIAELNADLDLKKRNYANLVRALKSQRTVLEQQKKSLSTLTSLSLADAEKLKALREDESIKQRVY